jgi:hypothetical protein
MLYKVKRGNHSFKPRMISLFFGKSMSKRVKFTKSCLYNIGVNQLNINKLFGFSKGLHHNNSYRFGWRSKDDRIQILAYMYKDGKRINEWDEDIHLCFVKPDHEYQFKIETTHKKCIFSVYKSDGSLLVTKQFDIPETTSIGYKLNPYFGGSVEAPKDMFISMK